MILRCKNLGELGMTYTVEIISMERKEELVDQ